MLYQNRDISTLTNAELLLAIDDIAGQRAAFHQRVSEASGDPKIVELKKAARAQPGQAFINLESELAAEKGKRGI